MTKIFKIEEEYREYKNKTFRLPTELIDNASKIATEYNISLNKFVIKSLEYALENMDENDKSLLSK